MDEAALLPAQNSLDPGNVDPMPTWLDWLSE